MTLGFLRFAAASCNPKSSPPISATKDWQKVRLGPIEPRDPGVDRVVIGLVPSAEAKAISKAACRWPTCGWPACRALPSPRTIRATCTPASTKWWSTASCPASANAIPKSVSNCSMRQHANEMRANFKLNGKLIVDDANNNRPTT